MGWYSARQFLVLGFVEAARILGGQLPATSETKVNHKRFLTEVESENL